MLLFLASIIVSFLAASSAPTPLYALYSARWGFSPLATTAVGGAPGHADLAGHAANVDDAAAAPSGHLRGQRAHEEVRRPDVGGEEAVKGRHVELRRGPEPGDPGVIDQNVNCADPLGELVQLHGVAEVGGGEAGYPALGADAVHHLRAARAVPPVHDDFRSAPAQLVRGCPPDARGRAGDQCAEAFEVSLLVHALPFHWPARTAAS